MKKNDIHSGVLGAKPRIFVMESGFYNFCVVGIASPDILNDKSNYELIDSNTGAFIAIKKLIN